jgi:hypothetical protein
MSSRDYVHPLPPGRAPFPGRWVGGVALILGPLVLLTGVLLRLPFHFFFPQQLAAVSVHPTRMAAAYGAVAAGNALLVLAVAAPRSCGSEAARFVQRALA